MTWMTMVNPEWMCPQHRAGEHKEIHDLVGFIRNGHIEKVIHHAARGQVFPHLIEERHRELEQYGGWSSPIDVPDIASELAMAELDGRVIDNNMRRLAANKSPHCSCSEYMPRAVTESATPRVVA